MKIPRIEGISIGLRLALCFTLITVLMMSGTAVLLWQFHLLRVQADQLTGISRELAAVMRLQTSLLAIDAKLNELAQSEDLVRLAKETEPLHAALLKETRRARAGLASLPPHTYIEPTFLPTLDVIENTLPSQLDALTDLARSNDWKAVRLRLANENKPLESQTSALVNGLDWEVSAEMTQASQNIAQLQRRIILIAPFTIASVLSVALFFAWAITRSITIPLGALVEGSRALARGEFQHRVDVAGTDELALLGRVFNETAERLSRLYDDLRSREHKVRESENELRQLIEFVPAHVFVLGPDGNGSSANRRVLEYHGTSLDEWKADQCQQKVVHRDDSERYLSELTSGLHSARPFEIEARLLHRDGEYRWFLSRFDPMRDEHGKVLRWYAARTDIEEGKRKSERTLHENLALREEMNRSGIAEEVLGSSEKLLRVLGEVSRVAPTGSTVLIMGETGTGKELVAQAIHRQSTRANQPFIRVNCAAIPSSLVSSELFGHEKGAFTGATQRRLGRFEAADGGTIFLDEIGELPLETQIALLRVLQERQFERIGSNRPITVDVRILAATNRNLNSAVAAGTFRQDLFYRLNVFPIMLPPLRERKEDIPMLVEYFAGRHAKRAGKNFRSIRKTTLELFESYSWPGNVRELQNVVERAVLVCDGDTLSVEDSWLSRESHTPASTQRKVELRVLGRLEPHHERELIEAALVESAWRISGPSGAAAKLGIPRQTLESKMARLGISRNRSQEA